MWDLAWLAPEQANYLDWFLKGVGFALVKNRGKKASRYPYLLLDILACFLVCLLGVKTWHGKRGGKAVFYRGPRVPWEEGMDQ